MKRKLLVLILCAIVFYSSCPFCTAQNDKKVVCISYPNDSSKKRGQVMFVKYMSIINSYIDKKHSNSQDLIHAIKCLEKITQIKSESDGNIIGKLFPKKTDAIKWAAWYQLHKESVCWNEKNREFYICD